MHISYIYYIIYFVILYHIILYHIILYYIILYYIVLYCNILYHNLNRIRRAVFDKEIKLPDYFRICNCFQGILCCI